MKLLFQPGDRLKHIVSGEECVVGKIEEQETMEGKKKIKTYTYSLGMSIEKSYMFLAEKAHEFFIKV